MWVCAYVNEGALGGQKKTLELELQVDCGSLDVHAENKLCPLKEQQVFFATEPSLQPLYLLFIVWFLSNFLAF